MAGRDPRIATGPRADGDGLRGETLEMREAPFVKEEPVKDVTNAEGSIARVFFAVRTKDYRLEESRGYAVGSVEE